MRRTIWLLAFFSSVSHCQAENEIGFPNYDSNKTCSGAFSESGTYPSKMLLKICLRSEQRNYNLSRTAWEYLSSSSAQNCVLRLESNAEKARKTHKFGYVGLVDPYTELWLCIDKKMHDEEAQNLPKPVEKW